MGARLRPGYSSGSTFTIDSNSYYYKHGSPVSVVVRVHHGLDALPTDQPRPRYQQFISFLTGDLHASGIATDGHSTPSSAQITLCSEQGMRKSQQATTKSAHERPPTQTIGRSFPPGPRNSEIRWSDTRFAQQNDLINVYVYSSFRVSSSLRLPTSFGSRRKCEIEPHLKASTSWASQATAREDDELCPAQYYVLGCVSFARCYYCSGMYQPTKEKTAVYFLFSCPRGITDIASDPKKIQKRP